jgi:hypothetical protein
VSDVGAAVAGTERKCERAAYEFRTGAAKVILFGAAKLILPGAPKLIL